MQNILITGGTGVVGTHLSKILLEKGYSVTHLSRNPTTTKSIKAYAWDPEKKLIEEEALHNADYIVHLAGANIGAKSWTQSRKEELYSSRVETANLIFEKIEPLADKPKAFISASGISIYGVDTGDRSIDESLQTYGDDFIAKLTVDWEKAADQFSNIGMRVVKMRTGLVLSKKGGALDKMTWPAKLGIAAPLGSGKQYISWIHIDDICNIYVRAIESEMNGSYNAVAPNPVTNSEFMRNISQIYKKPYFMPAVPGFMLKMVYGEMASIVLGGNYVVPRKITNEGFTFKFADLMTALKNLL